MSACKQGLNKPVLYEVGKAKDTWLVFPNASPKPLTHPRDCFDTVNAQCLYDKSLEECIDACENSSRCEFGYHIEGLIQGKNKKICLPLYTSDYYPEANPIYSLKDKSCFDSTNRSDVKVSSFLNKNRWLKNTLPDESNAVFVGDNVYVKGNGKYLSLTNNKAEMKENPTMPISILFSQQKELRDKVDFGDFLSFTTENQKKFLVLEIEKDGNITAKPHLNWEQTKNQAFQIMKLKKNKSHVLTYGDEFGLSLDGGLNFLAVSDDGTLFVEGPGSGANRADSRDQFGIFLTYGDDGLIRWEGEHGLPKNMRFTFSPTKKVYYCKDSNCVSASLSEAKTNGEKSTIHGKTTYLRNDCFGKCNWNKELTKTSVVNDNTVNKPKCFVWLCPLLIIFVVVILSLLLII